MTKQKTPTAQWLLLGVTLLLALSCLCTIFASAVTAAEAWQERAQARWPETTARVDRCGLQRSSTGRRENYYIHCRLKYATGVEQNVANVYSGSAPSREVWQYPPDQIGPLEDWVAKHPPGTPITVRYNPAHHTKIALVGSDMPLAGPRTASNIKQVEFWAGSFLVLLAISRIIRRRSARLNGSRSAFLNR